MATKKVSNVTPLPMSPPAHELPEDGTPVTFSQTFQRRVGTKLEDERVATVEDFEDSEWEVRRQTPDGWEFVEKVEGMPLDNELREDYGAGKYELTPVDPRTGKLVKQLRKVRLISATISPTGNGAMFPDAAYPPPQFGGQGGDDMPPWVRWQMQQAAEEKQESRRRADEALQRQRDFEEKLALREFERQEREERERKRKEEREAEDRRSRDERFSQILTAGVGLAQVMLGNKASASPQRDVNEVLLRELMEDRRNRTPQANGMRDSLELLVVLDKLAQTRASAMGGGRGDDDDDDEESGGIDKLLAGLLPAMLNRGAPAQLPDEVMDQMVEKAFANPATIQKIAMRNPQATASAFMQAIKDNPALERAVLSAVEKAADSEKE